MGLYNLLHILLFPKLLELIRQIPHPDSRVVDLACGSGIYALLVAAAYPETQVLGIDLQSVRIAAANEAARRLKLCNASFQCGDVLAEDLPRADMFLIADLLLYLPFDKQAQLLNRVRCQVRRPGNLIIKDHDMSSAWKVRFLELEENLGRHLRKAMGTEIDQGYSGKGLFLKTAGDRRDELVNFGMRVDVLRVDRDSVLPHIAFFCQTQK